MATVSRPRAGTFGVVIAVALIAITAAVPPANADEPRSTVADLRYGVALYEYYQGNYFAALSELTVADERGGIEGHGDNPELIEGGISLSFGMEQKAGDIFSRLLTADDEGEFERPLSVRNAAWFYLGKLRYLRGDWSGTDQSLEHIDGRFDPSLLQELETLKINLAIRRGDLGTAEEALDDADAIGPLRHYLYYNLANAYSRRQSYDKAQEYYDRLADLPLSDSPARREEQLVLYDKGLTAAGYSYILQGDPDEAIDQFEQVRLDSDFSNRALLGYGWAAAENDDYRLALRPWQTLSRRSLIHPAVQEAVIAVPFAYEQLDAPGQALQAYQDAESAFQGEITRIESVITQMERLDVLSALDIDPTDNRNWFLLNEDTGVQPSLIYLAELFSLNQFQGSVQELRDLLEMKSRLDQWQTRLNAYSYMLDQREINRQQQLQQIDGLALEKQLQVMRAERDAMAARLDRIREERDYTALLGDENQELVDMVEAAEANIARLEQAGEPVAEYREPLRRYKGLLYWEAAEAFPENEWQVQRTINEIDRAIAETETNLTRLNRVIVEAPDIAPYRARINGLRQRLVEQTARLNGAVELAEETLREKITGELRRQKKRLEHYQSQARLAVARLYDVTVHPELKEEAEQ